VFLRRRTRAERGPDRFTRVEDCDGVWRRRDEPPGRGRLGRSDAGLAPDQGDGLSDVQAIHADVLPAASEGLSASEPGRQEEVEGSAATVALDGVDERLRLLGGSACLVGAWFLDGVP